MAREDVQTVQKYLNDTYATIYPKFQIEQDGIPGSGTIELLTVAIQHELGFTGTAVDGVFGNDLIAKVPHLGPGVSMKKELIGLAQCALRCKGYDSPYPPLEPINDGKEFQEFGSKTQAAVKKLREDAQYYWDTFNPGGAGTSPADPPATVDKQVWKGLCRLVDFVLVQGGDEKIRTIQQYLNKNFQPAAGLNPSEGVVSSALARGLIKAVQFMTGVTADGLWGSGTSASIPAKITSSDSVRWRKILGAGLYINGYTGLDVADPSWESVFTAASKFAYFMRLAEGEGMVYEVTKNTTCALFVSYGNQARGTNDIYGPVGNDLAIGIDLSTPLTGKTKSLIRSDTELGKRGIKFVARYMQNAPITTNDKQMTPAEIKEIFSMSKPMAIAPIWQTSANANSYFNAEQGTKDANLAKNRAAELSMPSNITIYFAVDYDAFGSDLETFVVPYFKALKAENDRIGGNPIGVYGPRAVCTRITEIGVAKACFVADLSYGWSSNIGQQMPKEWELDQYFGSKADLYDNETEAVTDKDVEFDALISSQRHGGMWQGEGIM